MAVQAIGEAQPKPEQKPEQEPKPEQKPEQAKKSEQKPGQAPVLAPTFARLELDSTSTFPKPQDKLDRASTFPQPLHKKNP